ncbi:MAG: DNA mismatch repair endonuclease MutL [Chitinophagales bacterium]|nr:DNA mismatch repair endonuclease MutL [Chitinophagales bacterium]
MSDIIHLLPDAIANQIAAGEVIQRPASAVKELVENSIDAGSTSVTLIVKDAGKTLLQVVDNGCGMSETDARMSFERHATSKISSVDDLFAIRTKGFRGEALASVAAVAQVELKTRRQEDEIGTAILIEGTEVKSQEPCQTTAGTSISVKNLFYNVPVRRNFLRSNPVEMRHILEEFQRIALAHPDIFFSAFNNDIEIFHLKPGNLRQRITSVFGSSHNERLVPVNEQSGIVKITGFVGKPDFARKTRGEQYFFVNNRFIRNNYLNHAVFVNYDDLLPENSYPFFVLFIDIDPASIDINVHPTKQEIKFEDDKLVYGFVRAAVRHALAKYSVTPTLDFDQEDSFNQLHAQRLRQERNFTPPTAPIESAPRKDFYPKSEKPSTAGWEQLYEVAMKPDEEVTVLSRLSLPETEEEEILQKAQTQPIQIHNRFILSQIKSGFIVIDQQAAHERILFEKYLRSLNQHVQGSQKQLFPKTVNFSPDDAMLLRQILPEINALGFDVQEFGSDAFVVHGLPSDIEEGDEQEMLERLLENYKNNLDVLRLDRRQGLARSLAQQASIKAGKQLSVKEMQTLIDELFACEQPYIAPNKRNTFLTFDFEELEKRFTQK